MSARTAGRLARRRQDSFVYVRYLDDFPVIPLNNVWTDTSVRAFAEREDLRRANNYEGRRALHPDDHRPRRPRARPDLRLRHHRLRRRAMGPPLDHHRHLARGAGAGPRPHHGRALSVLPARRLAATASSRKPRSPAPRRRRSPTHGNIRHGFVYERVPHITLKSIANNAEIDVIWEKWQATLEPLREQLNAALKKTLAGVGDPARGRRQVAGRREEAARRLVAGAHRPAEGDRRLHRRQGRVRVPLRQALRRTRRRSASPARSPSRASRPHRVLGVDENDELIDPLQRRPSAGYGDEADLRRR